MIPEIDVTPLWGDDQTHSGGVAAEIVAAAESIGFFSIVGHGIEIGQLRHIRALLAELFASTPRQKAELIIKRDNYRGFIPLGFFTPNRDDPNAPKPDVYEGFKLHWECPRAHPALADSPIYGSNRWPAYLPELRGALLDYWSACDRITSMLLGVFESALGLPSRSLQDRFDAPVTNMTLLHYPPTEPGDDKAGIHPHKDTNVITLVHPDPVGGLFVRTRDGSWLEAKCSEQAMLVNTGDMMEVWSGGRFRSTPHKVINTTGEERYSFPYFAVPGHDQVIVPLIPPTPDYEEREPLEVGPWSLAVWQTNWPDTSPPDESTHLGTIDF